MASNLPDRYVLIDLGRIEYRYYGKIMDLLWVTLKGGIVSCYLKLIEFKN